MYQKSSKAGSQSGIDRLNGNGELSKNKDTEEDKFRKTEVISNIQYFSIIVSRDSKSPIGLFGLSFFAVETNHAKKEHTLSDLNRWMIKIDYRIYSL